jgi:hypothetical protein
MDPLRDSHYKDLLQVCEKIDRRSRRYQFDIDKDVAWDRLNEPGVYLPRQYLQAFGIDPGVFDARPEAAEVLQWALALAICHTFVDLEEQIIQLADRHQSDFEGCNSIVLLVEEEQKHCELFRRYGAHLESLRPDLTPRLNELHARRLYTHSHRDIPAPPDGDDFVAANVKRPLPPASATDHYKFWLGALLFEEQTVYLHDTLLASKEVIQPAWLTAHAAHRQEEVQHIATDVRLLEAANLSAPERRIHSMMYVVYLATVFRHYAGVDAPCKLVRELFPDLPAFEDQTPFLKSRFCEVIKTEKAFSHTRSLPGFDFLGA